MNIKFQCAQCGHKMKAVEKYAGRSIDCAGCGSSIVVPATHGVAAVSRANKTENDLEIFDDVDEELFEPPLKNSATNKPGVSRLGKKPAGDGSVGKVTKVKATKAPKSPGQGPAVGWPVVAGVCASMLFFLFGGVYFFINSGSLVGNLKSAGGLKAPETFVAFRHDNWVNLEYPEGFEIKSGGGTGGAPAWIRIESSGISIQVREDHAGEAIGDIAQAGQGGGVVDPAAMGADAAFDPEMDLSAVGAVHRFLLMKVEPEYTNYQEQPAREATAKMGEARYSTFTASGTFGGSIYGLRGTVVSGPDAIKIIATCNKRQWEAYKGAFVRIVESISR